MSQPKTAPPFAELIAGCERSAVHLETRDVYGVPEEDADFCAFLAGQRCDQADRGSWWNDFHSTIADAVGRGVSVRRMRVVSEPVTDYIRFEYADLWIFDDRLVRYSIFSGGGAFVEDLLDDDPATVKSYAEACELIWKRATPHDEFTV
ncbi:MULTISPECIES: DUF6879 family protein [Streptomyces]|uniref:DUF6879 domain-containing protein n=1 Tax=Streptomyces odorifer TaxID=53450 RepID=A0A7Y6C4X4_9ACTN|nr:MULTISPECIES: DUF6879 family protein [Streptomyces]NUV35100.1 hypothetical protein [Streptomyces sp. KAI-27]NUV47141.1 hypothetical protein [Streptomyces sp. CAI-78]MBL0777640.1 hypothetical protein [Streptomyces albidoflavus]MBL0799219.1 hypothetical protein [Streptomyces albidoflavus]MCG5118071.1 hypothetical protein [Streptomyces sp. T7(2022)]